MTKTKILIISCIALLVIGDVVFALYRNGVGPFHQHGANMVGSITKPDGWHWALVNDSDATATPDDGGIRINIKKTTGSSLDIVYYSTQASVVVNQKYTVSFSSKSDQEQTMMVTSYRSGGFKEFVALTPKWELHSYTYKAINVWKQPSRLPAFCIGANHGSIWIKDVTVKEATE
jgi:hypothetical protein